MGKKRRDSFGDPWNSDAPSDEEELRDSDYGASPNETKEEKEKRHLEEDLNIFESEPIEEIKEEAIRELIQEKKDIISYGERVKIKQDEVKERMIKISKRNSSTAAPAPIQKQPVSDTKQETIPQRDRSNAMDLRSRAEEKAPPRAELTPEEFNQLKDIVISILIKYTNSGNAFLNFFQKDHMDRAQSILQAIYRSKNSEQIELILNNQINVLQKKSLPYPKNFPHELIDKQFSSAAHIKKPLLTKKAQEASKFFNIIKEAKQSVDNFFNNKLEEKASPSRRHP